MAAIEQRQLKFRAWLFGKQQMVDVDELSYIRRNDRSMVVTYGNLYTTVPDQAIVMQIAGRRDKNETEIYEDDVIKYVETDPHHYYRHINHYYRVVFTRGCFMTYDPKSREFDYLYNISSEAEVVGNIYQHPDWENWSEGSGK